MGTERVGVARSPGFVASTRDKTCLSPRTVGPPTQDGTGLAEQQQRTLEEGWQRLAEAAAGTFRQQRDKMSALRVLTSWRRTAVMRRSKREALARLLRNCHIRRLKEGCGLWRAEALAIRNICERQRVVADAEAWKSKASKDATAAKVAAEELIRARELELEHEKAGIATAADLAAADARVAKLAAEASMHARKVELEREKAKTTELKEALEALQGEVRVSQYRQSTGRRKCCFRCHVRRTMVIVLLYVCEVLSF